MSTERPYPLPERSHRADGGLRRVGIEIEFGGLEGEATVRALTAELGGRARALSLAEWRIVDTDIGDLRVELDSRLIQKLARDAAAEPIPEWLAEVGEWTSELVERVATLVLPWEVVTGPLPLDRLHDADRIVSALRHAGALGTRHAPHYAFGVHLNPELPDLADETVFAYFKAFLCLKDWLRERCRPDLARVVSPFISDFEGAWVREVVSSDFQPDLGVFMDEYLRANPTRNRSLDMLPLFAHLDEARLRRSVDDPLVKGRPTLHYRLPNSEVDDAAFSLRELWTDWLEVERLAADVDRLARMGDAYARWLMRIRLPFDDGWARETAKWL
jgi:hypothetical protein